jgi:hypothetical protein
MVILYLSLPDRALHRNGDKIIQETAIVNGEKKTANVCLPDIYGPSRRPERMQSVYTPAFLNETNRSCMREKARTPDYESIPMT